MNVLKHNRESGTTDFEGKPVFVGGENNIAVFAINQDTGEPTLIQNIDTRGYMGARSPDALLSGLTAIGSARFFALS